MSIFLPNNLPNKKGEIRHSKPPYRQTKERVGRLAAIIFPKKYKATAQELHSANNRGGEDKQQCNRRSRKPESL
jgi:hypothetical protein